MMYKIAIFSLELDLHAYAIMDNLRNVHGVECHLVATNAMVDKGGLVWETGEHNRARIKSYEGEWFDIGEIDLIWWRRVNQPQRGMEDTFDEVSQQLISNEWRSSILGMVLDSFKGIWINKPHTDLYAGNKLFHLNRAAAVGSRIPKTLISQNFQEVLGFCKSLGGKVIVKKLLGSSLKPLVTLELSYDELVKAKESIQLCPAIYQEIISGTTHIRANCFGSEIHPISIEANMLDWRRDLSVPFSKAILDKETERKLVHLLEVLELQMGIMDMKYDDNGNLIWLEINTQGQFLFGEALSGYDLTNAFSEFLLKSIKNEKAKKTVKAKVLET